MYGSSTLYHSITQKNIKELFQTFDHASIYILIAGSYTPISLITLKDSFGYGIFTGVWLTAIFGVYMKFKYPNRFETLSLVLYLLMGWSVMIDIVVVKELLNEVGFYLLVAGGLSYTFGVYYYINDSKPYYHAYWHLFVLAGSIFHYFMTLFYII
jgi:hemolysin III